jgi:hypothetical protein
MDLEATALNVSTASNKAKDGLMSALQEKIGTVDDDRIIFPTHDGRGATHVQLITVQQV